MAHIPFLPELVLILGAGVIAAIGVAFLRLPAVAGFMLAGAVVGPSGLKLVHEPEVVEVLSEIGVVLLLFTIGLELSLDGLLAVYSIPRISQVQIIFRARVLTEPVAGPESEELAFFGDGTRCGVVEDTPGSLGATTTRTPSW